MKKIPTSLFSGIVASALIVGMPLAAQADGHEVGMDVPKIKAEIVLKGLENPTIVHTHYISSPLHRLSHRALIIAHTHTASWTFHRSHALRFALAIRGSQARSPPASLAVQLNHGTPFSERIAPDPA